MERLWGMERLSGAGEKGLMERRAPIEAWPVTAGEAIDGLPTDDEDGAQIETQWTSASHHSCNITNSAICFRSGAA